MFQRFTERARQAVVDAQEEARRLRHASVGTDHLLLGVMRAQEGVAAHVLEALGVRIEDVRARLAEAVGGDEPAGGGQIPFAPAAKKVLELALREALGLGHNYIGTEHLLLGVVEERDGPGARILLDLGVDADTVREAVVRELGATGQKAAVSSSQPVGHGPLRPGPRAREAARLATWSVVIGWVLGAVTLGAGILIGWAIWG